MLSPFNVYAVEGDQFNRTDNTVLGRFWTEEAGASISGNKLLIAAATGNYLSNQSYTTETCTDCEAWVSAKAASTTGAPEIHIRAQGTNKGELYMCWLQSSGWTLGRVDSDAVLDQLAIASGVSLVAGKRYIFYVKAVNIASNADITCKLYEEGADGRIGALLSTVTYNDSSADKKTTAGVIALSSNGITSTYDNFILINNDGSSDAIVDSLQIEWVNVVSPPRETINPFNSPWNAP